MNVTIISDKSALVYQTYTEGDTELNGEPAILIQEWVGSGIIELSQAGESVKINYDSVDAVIKALRAIMTDRAFYDVKF